MDHDFQKILHHRYCLIKNPHSHIVDFFLFDQTCIFCIWKLDSKHFINSKSLLIHNQYLISI
jgi:hypothetical protein